MIRCRFMTNRAITPANTVNNALVLKSILRMLVIACLLPACTPKAYPPGASIQTALISKQQFITADGAVLPLKSWLPDHTQPTNAIIVALHGFNDYSNFFQLPGNFLKQQGIACFAYDQRGFGASPQRGLWSGVQTYARDLRQFVELLTQRYPNIPIYLLGESMGGAVVITAMTNEPMPPIQGIILSAPAVWARETMPWYQQFVLWSLSHTLPWLTLTGESAGVVASDNIDMLRQLSQDPLVIKETRVETIYGLVNLMDRALESAKQLDARTLLLYGERDEVIPKEPTFLFLQNIGVTTDELKTVAIYENGYHMLLRDLQAKIVWQDISAWLNTEITELPSGADKKAQLLINNKTDKSQNPEQFASKQQTRTIR